VIQAVANEYGAKLSREFHPLRFQRWAMSDLNPWLWWLAPAAEAVKSQRQALAPDHPARQLEAAGAEITSACLDYGRALRDTLAEATFFGIYGNVFAAYMDEPVDKVAPHVDPRQLPFVKSALASIDKGGYPEALARVAYLMAHRDEPLPLARVELAQELSEEYRDLLPDLPRDQARRIGGEQEIVARYEPDKAVDTLPVLLANRKDRERLFMLLDRVLADKRVQRIEPSPGQRAMLARIRRVLGWTPGRTPALAAPRRNGRAAALLEA
jgi:hypothetical protein